MKKPKLSSLFLYKHRFIIGYLLLGLAFVALLFCLPLLSPDGLSEAEMQSAVDSHNITMQTIASGEIVDLPYHLLQKFSIKIIGLTTYAIKLPSIIIGLLLGFLLILLLNRWFKNNVAILASILTILSAPFLYLAGSGTPLIMLVFWPTLLLWLGSKIQGKSLQKTLYAFFFAGFLLLSLFTPHLIYLAIFIVIYALAHPHLRFMIKSLPRIPFIITTMLGVACLVFLGFGVVKNGETVSTLFFMEDYSLSNFFRNIGNAFIPFFSWSSSVESTFLSPMIGLASLALAITGLISTANGFFASRNSIASLLIVFTVLLAGMKPESAVLIILPLAILTAHAMRYILEKWYGLFPENPYARIFALLPISTFLGLILIPSLSHYIFGYRYNPPVANAYNNDLNLIYEHATPDTTILIQAGTLKYDFYKILEDCTPYRVTSTIENDTSTPIITLGKWPSTIPYKLNRIYTSSKSQNSDRIYLYTDK